MDLGVAVDLAPPGAPGRSSDSTATVARVERMLELTAGLPERALAAGEVLIANGDEPTELFVLVSGRVVVHREGSDTEIAASGACIGEMGVLLGRPHGADIVAVEDTVVRILADAGRALDDRPEVLRVVATVLARRLDLLNEYLLDLQRQYGDVDGGLGMVHQVARTLANHHGGIANTGSEREPDPLY